MRIQLPKHYTILITRTGTTPIALSIRPWPILISALVLVSLPVAWVASLMHNNTQLSERNESLTETASEVLSELDSLDAEVQDLQERAGLPDRTLTVPEPINSQGGVAQEVEAETLFELAENRLPELSFLVDGRVRPALEETLAEEATREAAFPNGTPLKGQVDVSSELVCALIHSVDGDTNSTTELIFEGRLAPPFMPRPVASWSKPSIRVALANMW